MGTIPSTGELSFSNLQTIYGLSGPISLSQFHNVPLGKPAYYAGEEALSNIYSDRVLKETGMDGLRGKSFSNNAITLGARGNTGNENIRIAGISATQTVEHVASTLLSPTITKNFVIPRVQNGEVIQTLRVELVVDNGDIFIQNSSIAANGVEQVHPTRVRDKNNYYAANDQGRRNAVITGVFAWGGYYYIDLYPNVSVSGLGYIP